MSNANKCSGLGGDCSELKRVISPMTADKSPAISNEFLICFSVEAKKIWICMCVPFRVFKYYLRKQTCNTL